MSANLLLHPGKVHTFRDDLESFLHVLAWMMLRYVPADDFYQAADRGDDMTKFDQHSVRDGWFDRGGRAKSDALGAGTYPSPTFEPERDTPLFFLLQTLCKPFKSLYEKRLGDGARRKMKGSKSKHDEILDDLSDALRQREQNKDIECLESVTWFMSEMKKALGEEDWPTDDAADANLPIASSKQTDRQIQLHTSQLQYTQSQRAMSKAPSMNSKRARSPTREPSAKRRRGIPDASGPGI